MSRKSRKARRSFNTRMSFNEMCRKAGIQPKQKIIIRRFLKEVKIYE